MKESSRCAVGTALQLSRAHPFVLFIHVSSPYAWLCGWDINGTAMETLLGFAIFWSLCLRLAKIRWLSEIMSIMSINAHFLTQKM